MSVELGAIYTLTAPSYAGSTVAVFNDPTSGNFVGYLTDISGLDSPEVRESADNIVEGDGGVHGNFYYGRRSLTLEGLVAPDPGATLNARIDRLLAATNALRGDATLTWTETGSVAKLLNLRRQQPVRITERRPKRFLVAMVSADARIVSNASTTTTLNATVTNAGNVGYLPSFSVGTPSATVTLTNTTTSQSFVFTGLSGGGAVTVNFATKTITQGGVNKYSAITFPSSVWWELASGANAITATGGGTVTMTWRSAWI